MRLFQPGVQPSGYFLHMEGCIQHAWVGHDANESKNGHPGKTNTFAPCQTGVPPFPGFQMDGGIQVVSVNQNVDTTAPLHHIEPCV